MLSMTYALNTQYGTLIPEMDLLSIPCCVVKILTLNSDTHKMSVIIRCQNLTVSTIKVRKLNTVCFTICPVESTSYKQWKFFL